MNFLEFLNEAEETTNINDITTLDSLDFSTSGEKIKITLNNVDLYISETTKNILEFLGGVDDIKESTITLRGRIKTKIGQNEFNFFTKFNRLEIIKSIQSNLKTFLGKGYSITDNGRSELYVNENKSKILTIHIKSSLSTRGKETEGSDITEFVPALLLDIDIKGNNKKISSQELFKEVLGFKDLLDVDYKKLQSGEKTIELFNENSYNYILAILEIYDKNFNGTFLEHSIFLKKEKVKRAMDSVKVVRMVADNTKLEEALGLYHQIKSKPTVENGARYIWDNDTTKSRDESDFYLADVGGNKVSGYSIKAGGDSNLKEVRINPLIKDLNLDGTEVKTLMDNVSFDNFLLTLLNTKSNIKQINRDVIGEIIDGFYNNGSLKKEEVDNFKEYFNSVVDILSNGEVQSVGDGEETKYKDFCINFIKLLDVPISTIFAKSNISIPQPMNDSQTLCGYYKEMQVLNQAKKDDLNNNALINLIKNPNGEAKKEMKNHNRLDSKEKSEVLDKTIETVEDCLKNNDIDTAEKVTEVLVGDKKLTMKEYFDWASPNFVNFLESLSKAKITDFLKYCLGAGNDKTIIVKYGDVADEAQKLRDKIINSITESKFKLDSKEYVGKGFDLDKIYNESYNTAVFIIPITIKFSLVGGSGELKEKYLFRFSYGNGKGGNDLKSYSKSEKLSGFGIKFQKIKQQQQKS